MSLLTSAQRFFPGFLGGGNRPQGREVLALRPRRNPSVSWEQNHDEKTVVLTVQRRKDWWTNFAARMFGIPANRKIELTDEISSYVWLRCDGSCTAAQIADEITQQYKLNKRQSEVSVLTFLRTLQMKRLIGVAPNESVSNSQKKVVHSKSRRKEERSNVGRRRRPAK